MESVYQDELTKNSSQSSDYSLEPVVSKRFSRHHWKPHGHIVFTSTRDSCFNLFTTRQPSLLSTNSSKVGPWKRSFETYPQLVSVQATTRRELKMKLSLCIVVLCSLEWVSGIEIVLYCNFVSLRASRRSLQDEIRLQMYTVELRWPFKK